MLNITCFVVCLFSSLIIYIVLDTENKSLLKIFIYFCLGEKQSSSGDNSVALVVGIVVAIVVIVIAAIVIVACIVYRKG